jgi:hypothetical protein
MESALSFFFKEMDRAFREYVPELPRNVQSNHAAADDEKV